MDHGLIVDYFYMLLLIRLNNSIIHCSYLISEFFFAAFFTSGQRKQRAIQAKISFTFPAE
jgi:hypothetical protein